ncbi:MAG: hypothetical protein U0235_02805 [Polyangiaceae bacterium]
MKAGLKATGASRSSSSPTQNCTDAQRNTVAAVHVAAANKATVPTYVVGIGNVTNLSGHRHERGGTTAIQVSTTSPCPSCSRARGCANKPPRNSVASTTAGAAGGLCSTSTR